MTKPIPAGFTNLTPHIIVKNAAQAIEFYEKAFGAEEINRHQTDAPSARASRCSSSWRTPSGATASRW